MPSVHPVAQDGDDGVELGGGHRRVGLVDDRQPAVEVEAELGRPAGGQRGAEADDGDGDDHQQADPERTILFLMAAQ